ncbi:MAG: immunoglobulin domain-containing protein, partial [Bacteroidota bacterium]
PESHIVCENSDVTMYVLGNGIGEIHSYQWYKDGAPVNFPEGTPLEEQKLLRIEGATIDDIGNYYAEVTVEDCRGVQTFTSDVAAVYILEQTEITEQPSSYTAQAGENATFRVEAHMKGIVPPYYQHDFQWYMRTKTTPQVATMLEDGDKYEGAETEELTIMNVEADDYDYEYYVVVTGRCGDPQMSDPVEIMDVPGVTIVSQPESVSICEGSDIDFTVDADPTVAGTQIEYQWFKDGMSLSNDSKYDGVNTNKLVINDIVDSDAGMYYAEIRAVGGNMATTDEAELTVDLMAEITTQPEGLTVKKDESVKLMVEAAGTEPMTYQWYKDGAELAGEESAEFEIRYAEENDAGEYHVAITNVCGTVESQKVTLNVDASIPNSVTEAGGVKIYSNTPNPFNSTTQIKFYLPAAADVSVRITDNFGKDISTLLDDFIGAGEHTVDFESDDHNLSSGVYYFTIAIDGVQHTRRMVLVK